MKQVDAKQCKLAIKKRIRKLRSNVRHGYQHGKSPDYDYIGGYDITRWEAQIEILEELLDELEKV